MPSLSPQASTTTVLCMRVVHQSFPYDMRETLLTNEMNVSTCLPLNVLGKRRLLVRGLYRTVLYLGEHEPLDVPDIKCDDIIDYTVLLRNPEHHELGDIGGEPYRNVRILELLYHIQMNEREILFAQSGRWEWYRGQVTH